MFDGIEMWNLGAHILICAQDHYVVGCMGC
jgi:hypothetical protein